MNKLEQLHDLIQDGSGPYCPVWSISPSFAAFAEATLMGIDVVDARRAQDEFEAERLRVANAASAERKAKGEPDPKPYQMVGPIAVIPVSGPMSRQLTSMSRYIGGTSTIAARRLVRLAEVDSDVSQIFMVWETPGGECAGLPEFADQIRETNAVKPVTSFLNDGCYSAGVYGALQAGQVFMNRMGMMGSINTLMTLIDSSASAAMRGIKVHVFTEGDYKGIGTPGTPLEAHHAAHLQQIVKHFFDDFKAAVATGRGMTDEQVAAVADGREFTAQQALDYGLIDGICSLDECVTALLQNDLETEKPTKAGTPKLAATAAHDPASVPTGKAKETTMDLKATMLKALAFVSGSPEMLAKAGITDAEATEATTAVAKQETPPINKPAASTAPDPALTAAMQVQDAKYADLEKRVRSSEDAALQAFAESVVDDAITNQHRMDPSERDEQIGLCKMAALLDGDGKRAAFSDGKVVEGTNMKTYRAGIAKRAEIKLFRTVVPGEKPGGTGAPSQACSTQAMVSAYNSQGGRK